MLNFAEHVPRFIYGNFLVEKDLNVQKKDWKRDKKVKKDVQKTEEKTPTKKRCKKREGQKNISLTWRIMPLDIQQLTLFFCDIQVIRHVFDLFPHIIQNSTSDFYRHLGNVQWPIVEPHPNETGYSIPFQHIYSNYSEDIFLHFTSRSTIQAYIENKLSEKYTQQHIAEIICYVMKIKEHSENEGIESESKDFQILFHESMRWIVNIFDAIGQPEIRLSLNYYEQRYVDGYIRRSEEILDTNRRSDEIAICCKSLGILFSDPDIHRKATQSTVNKLLSHLTNYRNRSSYAISNTLWCLYMLSISPRISVYENITDVNYMTTSDVWANLQYLLTIPGENDGGFLTLLDKFFDYYENDSDILAKLFRITANITCLPHHINESSLLRVTQIAIQAMQRYPDSLDLQGKCLALVVNVHEIYDDNIDVFIELGLQAVLKFPEDSYLQGKFLYIIENCLTGHSHIPVVLVFWPQISNFLEHAKSFSVLEITAHKCVRAATMHM